VATGWTYFSTNMASSEYERYRTNRHDFYTDQRKNLDSSAFQMGNLHDQWVLTLSSGALGLSVTFLEKIVSHPEEWTKIILFWSWSALGFSLLAAFYSIHYSYCAMSRQIAILDDEYEQFQKTTTKERPEGIDISAKQKHNRFVTITQWWSLQARMFTVTGIALFCLFCFCNIGSSFDSSDSQSKKGVIISADPQLFKLLQTYKEDSKPK